MTVPDQAAAALAPVLGQLRLSGSIFLRAEYTEAWSYRSLDGPSTAAMLGAGPGRLILFHVVAAGECWIALDGGEPHWARAGDVIVLPYANQHTMGGRDGADPVPIETIVAPPPWSELPVVRHGQGGPQTDVICGWLTSEDPLFDPGLRALPPVFVVRPPAGPSTEWVRASIAYALSAPETADLRGPSRIADLLLVEILALHLATAPAAASGWLAALRDPVLAPALACLHGEPERKWTVGELAADVAVSTSVLDERFRSVLGRSPIRYLTDWRMHLAEDLLASTELTVAAVAREVGYEAEEAFARAFKRSHGVAPGGWRRARTA